ncbi:hypothetical protein PCE1_003380 [Barthelona sp. PCE]
MSESTEKTSVNTEKLESFLFGALEAGDAFQTIFEPARKIQRTENMPLWEDIDETQVEIDLTDNQLKKLRETEEDNTIKGQSYTERVQSKILKTDSVRWAVRKSEIEEREEEKAVLQEVLDIEDVGLDILSFERLNEVTQRNKCVMEVTKLEATDDLLVVSSADSHLRIFQPDYVKSRLVRDLAFKNYPIKTFFTFRDHFYVFGKRKFFLRQRISSTTCERRSVKHFFVTDYSIVAPNKDGNIFALAGKNGDVGVFQTASLNKIASFSTNDDITSLLFNENMIYAANKSGRIHVFDMETLRPIHTFFDHGGSPTTQFAITEHHIAIGSDSGCVNLYTRDSVMKSRRPEPLHCYSNLVEPITQLKFSHDGAILAWCSLESKNAVRLANVVENLTYQNFPPQFSSFGRVSAIAFSENSGFFYIGNRQGRVHAFRLKQYTEQ